jgi:hypothetical protein
MDALRDRQVFEDMMEQGRMTEVVGQAAVQSRGGRGPLLIVVPRSQGVQINAKCLF